MMTAYETDSPEAIAAIAAAEPDTVWIHGSITYVDDKPPSPPPDPDA